MSDLIVDVNKKVPLWGAEGMPLNLQAAATDALDWLMYFRLQDPALERCRAELRKFLDEAEK